VIVVSSVPVPTTKVTPIVGGRVPRMRDTRAAGDRSVKEIPSVVLFDLDKPHCPMGKQLRSPSFSARGGAILDRGIFFEFELAHVEKFARTCAHGEICLLAFIWLWVGCLGKGWVGLLGLVRALNAKAFVWVGFYRDLNPKSCSNRKLLCVLFLRPFLAVFFGRRY
jgi:hypothetical protein